MNDEEYRALVAAGPAVVMVAKEDMLKLLDALHSADILLEWHNGNPAGVPYSQLAKDYKKKRRVAHPRKPKCVNAHDRCYGGAGGPCDYCEFTICDND